MNSKANAGSRLKQPVSVVRRATLAVCREKDHEAASTVNKRASTLSKRTSTASRRPRPATQSTGKASKRKTAENIENIETRAAKVSKCENVTAVKQKGNSKNKKNGLQCRKRNLDVKMSKFKRFVLFFLQYLNTSTTGAILITQLVCKFEKTRTDYLRQMYSYMIMKPLSRYIESASGHKNFWKYSKTRRHARRQDTSLMWITQLMKLLYLQMDLSMGRMQSYNLYICYVVCYKKLELCQKDHKKQCDKQPKKLKNVEIECTCYSLSRMCNLDTGHSKRFDEKENCNRMLQEKNEDMRHQLQESNDMIKELKKQLEMLKNDKLVLERKNLALKDKLSMWKNKHEKVEKDYKELILEYGRLSVENDSKVNKVKETEQFQKIFIPRSSTSSARDIKGNNSCKSGPVPNVPFSSSPLREQSVDTSGELLEIKASQVSYQKNNEPNGRDLNTENESNILTKQPRLSIEVVERDNEGCISLMNQPSSSVPADVSNAYKFLLLTISDRLLYDDIIQLQEWANKKFTVQTNLNAYEIFMELDKNGAISALDLSQLCLFFESIVRHDILYVIDEFKNGDYDKLKKLVYQNKCSKRVGSSYQVHSPRFRLPNSNTPGSSQRFANNAQADVSKTQVNVSNSRVFERHLALECNNLTSVGRDRQGSGRFGSNFPNTSSSRVRSGLLMHRNSENDPDVSIVANTRGNPGNEHRASANDTPLMTEPVRHKQTLQSRQPPSQCNHSRNAAGRCNGAHSHTDALLHGASNGDNQDNWLCDHYKRRCLVKFDCCNKYWACHRCHNNESTCGHRKLKSRDTTMIKCVECRKEQKFGQFCVSCDTQFADFFCGICKHLTGTDDHPYHCDKCGICRIHGDRSYHCDVCGICLDVQLRGNHKCRPDSAHDECCICLEDAFTGCQILPCSHKVHKECATQMIRMGLTRCPLCRESFAHKLERRPVKKKTTRRR